MGFFDNLKSLTTSQNAAASTPQETAKKKILVVEDEQLLGDGLALKLQHEGFEAIRAENGKEGLEKLSATHPDLILLDLKMPIMDGKEMLHRVRAIPEFAKLPVIVLTNEGSIDNMEQTKSFDNASEFLIKSNVSLEEIVQKIRTFTPGANDVSSLTNS